MAAITDDFGASTIEGALLCAVECRDDPSCLAYEWVESEEVCYLKSRSLSGDLVKKKDSLIGFCLDEELPNYIYV
ncbi:hypothetical protein ANCDUO_00183 [Ancylostoma duodenale]|uniref:Apple domain-containing protein n=1 Tax=Ancylostoma duodenale TaxID=51022 RepID=A0A0C2HCQ8_9BILA|nr:hypothetical protein ANCDUO_00183 [Ancylostoma duodenale]